MQILRLEDNMKTDIFEDMKERVGCENISDLPYRKTYGVGNHQAALTT